MGIWQAFKHALDPSPQYGEFELLETETGEPQNLFARPQAEEEQPIEPGKATVAEQTGLGENETIGSALDGNLAAMDRAFCAGQNSDCIIRRFRIAGKVRAAAVYLTGMANAALVNDFILRQLMQKEALEPNGRTLTRCIVEDRLAVGDVSCERAMVTLVEKVLDGNTVVFVDGEREALVIETTGFEKRSISQPTAEKVVRGPQEGFTESLRTNITLLRRIIRTPDLVSEIKPLGGENNLRLALVYRESIVNPKLLCEVKRRVSKVKMHYMIGEGMLQQLLEDRKYAPISQMLNTERPDRAAAMIMQGCIAIACDGSPFVSVLPITLSNLLNTPEDVYLRPIYGSITRIIRYIGVILSVFLPGLYVAVIMYHPELISLDLVNTIAQARRMVTLPIYLEILFMLFIFQMVRESGMRVPGSMGQAVGVIGGLIMGQASVDANIVSSVALILVALTGLGTYSIPLYAMQYIVIAFRLIILFSATVAGLPGVVAATVICFAYLSSIKSFGVPLLSPFAPKTYSESSNWWRSPLSARYGMADYTNSQRTKAPKSKKERVEK